MPVRTSNTEFAEQRGDYFRDSFMFRISDKELSEKMQLIDDLILHKAIKMARQSELIKAQIGQ